MLYEVFIALPVADRLSSLEDNQVLLLLYHTFHSLAALKALLPVFYTDMFSQFWLFSDPKYDIKHDIDNISFYHSNDMQVFN